MAVELADVVVETIKSAAQKLTGYRRRQFQAEVAEQYCDSQPRRAEQVFGWGRAAVLLGLHERRSGVRCLDDYSTRGRRKTEEKFPELTAVIQTLVEPESQADPKFQTPFAYTRITAAAVRTQLLARAAAATAQESAAARHVPCERTTHDILNRLGYRLRRVRKSEPKKTP